MICFECIEFRALTVEQLYQIMILRQEVFVVEQNCAYLDADGMDLSALHLLGINKKRELIAYTRILPPGMPYQDYISFGRVITRQQVRGSGLGKALLSHTLQEIDVHYGEVPIKISAQTYLIRFYESFGFQAVGEEYLEDNIPHIAMVRLAT